MTATACAAPKGASAQARRAPICPPGFADPFDTVEWTTRDVAVKDYTTGAVIFEQKAVECPVGWSENAVTVAASKYFFGLQGTPQRETSVRRLIHRVARPIADWAAEDGYADDAEQLYFDLVYLLLHQYAAFNSPVWFNLGLHHVYGETSGGGSAGYKYDPAAGVVREVDPMVNPQVSACQPYDALVSTPTGPVRIGDIVERNQVGLRVFDKDGTTTVTAVKANGVKPVYRIVLQSGHAVEATADHVVWAAADRKLVPDWKRVDQVRAGEYMIYRRNTDVDGQTEVDHLRLHEAFLAGWLQGDGFVGQYETGTNRSLTVEFMTVNEDEHSKVMSLVETVFAGVHCKVTDVESQDPDLDVKRVRLYGERLRPFVEKYGLLARGLDMEVPAAILSAPREVQTVYLRALFQADGYVSVRDNAARVGLGMISVGLLRQVQVMLANLGIYSRLKGYDSARTDFDRKPMWTVLISNKEDRARFAELVNFVSADKRDKLAASLVGEFPGKGSPDRKYFKVLRVELVGELPVCDIQTESGNYLSGGNVVVHNCFILGLTDSIDSVWNLAKDSARLFKYGSGVGTDLSPLRSKYEPLSGGGRASGPLSFGEVIDVTGGTIKSGGRTRRAAIMLTLKDRHPEVRDFARVKAEQDRLAKLLITAGVDPDFNGPAYGAAKFQNANLSVRLTDEFMHAAEAGGDWQTWWVTHRATPGPRFAASHLMDDVVDGTWECGDPGVQYETTIQRWHTCPNTAPINSSNPCSEYKFLDDTACNLASLRLTKFRRADGSFDVDLFRRAVSVLFTAQEILVGRASYPTPRVAEMSYKYRPLGIGYADLGALLMVSGLAYDSDAGRGLCAAVTALMTGEAYRTSAEMADRLGAFEGFEANREPMLNVIRMHASAVLGIPPGVQDDLRDAAYAVWESAISLGEANGFRNAQASVLAPTGTISFLMDCDTTGIEPELGLVKYKALAGGGHMKLVNRLVPVALSALGYDPSALARVVDYVAENGTPEGCPLLKPAHLAVFDTSFRPEKGTRTIPWQAHLGMMKAAQPFISGAISKTVNLPEDVTRDEIRDALYSGWRDGLKALAMYRDGSKWSQPLSTKEGGNNKTGAAPAAVVPAGRRKLPATRPAVTHHFNIGGHDGYLTVGLYDDGTPGELFIKMNKEGSTVSGLMDTVGILTSMCLQHGVPLDLIAAKLSFMDFEPRGFTQNPDIRVAKSPVDYTFRWLGGAYGSGGASPAPPALPVAAAARASVPAAVTEVVTGPPCKKCGGMTRRAGRCYHCPNCQESTGGCE